MPFEKKINSPFGVIAVWRLTDSLEELEKQYPMLESEQKRYISFSSPRRKKEFLATRILLSAYLDNNDEIIYPDSTGKPILKSGNQNISISHSADFAVLILSDKKVGIDIEQTSRNINRIATRFLHPSEFEFIEKQDNKQELKILFWAAKEAVFKTTEYTGIEFNTQILISPFKLNLQGGNFEASLTHGGIKKHYQLKYCLLKNNMLVYCVEDN